MQVGDKVFISGDVDYGANTYRVDSNGIIQFVGATLSLVTIEYIDGDYNVDVLVANKYIYNI